MELNLEETLCLDFPSQTDYLIRFTFIDPPPPLRKYTMVLCPFYILDHILKNKGVVSSKQGHTTTVKYRVVDSISPKLKPKSIFKTIYPKKIHFFFLVLFYPCLLYRWENVAWRGVYLALKMQMNAQNFVSFIIFSKRLIQASHCTIQVGKNLLPQKYILEPISTILNFVLSVPPYHKTKNKSCHSPIFGHFWHKIRPYLSSIPRNTHVLHQNGQRTFRFRNYL